MNRQEKLMGKLSFSFSSSLGLAAMSALYSPEGKLDFLHSLSEIHSHFSVCIKQLKTQPFFFQACAHV